MALMLRQRLYGWTTSTRLRPAGERWLVVVVLGRRRVLRTWLADWDLVRRQIDEADALRRPQWPTEDWR